MFKNGLIMMMITLVSRVLGLFRSVIIAYYFGVSAETDAFFSAFKISNFFRQLLGEGALGTSFIPVYNEKIKNEGEEEGRKFIFSIVNLVFIFSVIVSIFMMVFSKEIINLIVNGFSIETKLIASNLLRIMSSYFIFISVAGIIFAILNNFKCFAIPASTSIFFNIAIICGAIFFGKTYGIKALAYGVLVGGLFQFLIVLPQFLSHTKGYSFKINFKDKYLKEVFILIGPMLIGIVARQLNTVVDQFFASYLETGALSALENATRIYNLPIGVFGISISTVIFPSLSKKIVNKNMEGVKKDIRKGLNILLFLVIPSIFAFTIYGKDMVSLVFQYGKFDENAVKVTGNALLFYSLGLYFYTAIHLLTRAFYGMKNSKDPVKFSIISIVLNIVLNAILIKPMGYRGLAFSTSIAAFVNFSLLLIVFRKKYLKIEIKNVLNFSFKTIVSSFIAIGISFYVPNIILKFIVFGVVYLGIWSYPIYKKKMEVF